MDLFATCSPLALTKSGMPEASHTPELLYDLEDDYRPEPEPEPQPPAWQDGSYRIGIHTSIAGDITNALDSAQKLGCNALQIFSTSPRMWPRPGSRVLDVDATRFRARREELALGPLVIHCNYLINMASSEPVMRTRAIQAFHEEIVRGMALGADFLVLHPGSALGGPLEPAIARIAHGLRQAVRGLRMAGLRILIENTSGMGAAVGARFGEIRAIFDAAPDVPLGCCLDTAHTLEAGYEIRTADGLTKTLDAIESTVGLASVAVIHVNDSKTPLGSRVDRHQHIGRGEIGLEAFARILTHPRLGPALPAGLPGRAFILETPIDRPGDDRKNVRALWKLSGVPADLIPKAVKDFSMFRSVRPPAEKARGARARAGKAAAPGKKRSSRPRGRRKK
jgi:deoxyribonuclease-4